MSQRASKCDVSIHRSNSHIGYFWWWSKVSKTKIIAIKSFFKSELKSDDMSSIGGCDFTTKDIERKMMVPIESKSGKNPTLKKDDIWAEVNIINESEINVDQVISYTLQS